MGRDIIQFLQAKQQRPGDPHRVELWRQNHIPVGPEGRLSIQRELDGYFQALRSTSIYLTRFWTCLEPVTPFCLLISPFLNRNVYPYAWPIIVFWNHITYLALQVYTWRGILP